MRGRGWTIVATLGALSLVAAACGSVDPTIAGAGPRGVPTTLPPPTTTTTLDPSLTATEGYFQIPVGGADLYNVANGTVVQTIAQGLTLGFISRSGEWLEVVTPCGTTAFMTDTQVTPVAKTVSPATSDLSQLVLALDPGHGGRDWGGVGPTGASEKSINLDISLRLKQLLETPHEIDFVTGAITPGSSYPAVKSVLLTRSPDGPDGGDYELGLAYRAGLANAAGAHALISIHNNTVPTQEVDRPGSEVFYSLAAPDSDRLAGLIYDELVKSLAPFDANWSGGTLLGARARMDPKSGGDYYGLLRRAQMPSVIVEGAYLSEPEEEALLKSADFQQAYAEGVYRGIVRFFTTADTSNNIFSPEPFPDDAGTVSTRSCKIPSQADVTP
ncbi:MAG TPA: N-acetylmuramoyl-L-alanine amidase [Actinobacteria bacterium]|nr:N-acetylmuramoyl-L-alanine amidase [Actinomycetota bacterium]